MRLVLATGLCFALAFSLQTCGARAQEDADAIPTARVCVSELGLYSEAECVQIVHATMLRALRRGRSYRAELHSYSPRATGRLVYVGHEWIPLLHPDRLPGVEYNETGSRETVRVQFAAYADVAWRALRGVGAVPCPGATEWAARWCVRCRERMRAARYRRAACSSPMLNAWFAPQVFGTWSGSHDGDGATR